MPLFLLKIGKWLLGKSLMFAIAGAVAVALFALWTYGRDAFGDDAAQSGKLAELQELEGKLYENLEVTRQRLIAIGNEIEETQRKIEAANQVIEYLGGLLQKIERWLTLSAAERAAAERDLAAAQAERARQTELQNALVNERSKLRFDRVALTEEAKQIAVRIQDMDVQAPGLIRSLKDSWNKLRPYILSAIAIAIFAPILLKLFAFYVWAPMLSFSSPMRIAAAELPLPRLEDKGVSIQLALEKGQRAWVKESFLQASDESLRRRTRFVLNWSIPFTCIAAGLVELIELVGEGDATGKVTVSPQRRAELEIAMVEVPEGGQMVARPSCIAGVVSRDGSVLRIKRRWRLFHPHAWLTFQFRYFVFQGPCALIVTGVRGVRFEAMDSPSQKGRRTNTVATIGFTPDLIYAVTRAETFWSYFRGFNPLFDDVFRGRGAFLCQEITEKEASTAGRFWLGMWNSVLKILGV